jgi:hypothetical protein
MTGCRIHELGVDLWPAPALVPLIRGGGERGGASQRSQSRHPLCLVPRVGSGARRGVIPYCVISCDRRKFFMCRVSNRERALWCPSTGSGVMDLVDKEKAEKRQREGDSGPPKAKAKKARMGMMDSFKFLATNRYLGCMAVLVVAYGLTINFTEVKAHGT